MSAPNKREPHSDDSFGLIQVLSFKGSQYLVVTNQLLKQANQSKSRDLTNQNERFMSDIERNRTFYRNCSVRDIADLDYFGNMQK